MGYVLCSYIASIVKASVFPNQLMGSVQLQSKSQRFRRYQQVILKKDLHLDSRLLIRRRKLEESYKKIRSLNIKLL